MAGVSTGAISVETDVTATDNATLPFALSSPNLIPFFENRVTLQDYLALDDGVMNTYFQVWMTSPDKILSDLAQRFINRKVFKSIVFSQENEAYLDIM